MLKYKTQKKNFLTKDEEIDLFKRYQQSKSAKLKDEIISNYSALAFFYAKKMAFQKHQYEDIVQEAFLGLSIAIDKFNTESNCRFVHYAGFWIKAQIFNYIFDNFTIVNVPASPAFMKGFWKIKKYSDLTNEEAAAKLNLPLDQIEILRNVTNNPEWSLDIVASNTEREGNPDFLMNKASIKKSLENMSITSFEERFLEKHESNFQLNTINKELKHLKAQEKDVLFQYYMEEKTFDEIGKKYNVTRQRIEQIQKSAIRKIKENLKKESHVG